MKRIQPKHMAHIVMIAFASASLFNIQAFFQRVENDWRFSWSLAIALAAVLVIMAGLLSEMEWRLNASFVIVLVVTIGLTIASGSIQAGAYMQHLPWFAGVLLGFALPGLGELGLALAISAYTKSLDGREVSAAQRELATGVRRHLVEAIAHVDKSLIEAQVNRAVGKVTKELVDSVVVDMIAELRGNRISQIAEIQPCNTVKSEILHEGEDNISKMNAAKQAKILQRRQTILQLIGGDGLPLSEIAERAGCSVRTIRTDLDALQTAGHGMSINGVVKLH